MTFLPLLFFLVRANAMLKFLVDFKNMDLLIVRRLYYYCTTIRADQKKAGMVFLTDYFFHQGTLIKLKEGNDILLIIHLCQALKKMTQDLSFYRTQTSCCASI